MRNKAIIQKRLVNTRLLKNYGSWIYCDICNNTVGYLCYTTYDRFYYDFVCKCGSKGIVEIKVEESAKTVENNEPLSVVKNRFCCPKDDSPLFSVIDKNLNSYSFNLICKKCKNRYKARAIQC